MTKCKECGSITTAPRRLREYKGVKYNPDHPSGVRWWHESNGGFTSLVTLMTLVHGYTDADFPDIYALRDDPYEPVETLEEVIEAFAWKLGTYDAEECKPWIASIRAAVLAEQGGGADA